MYVDSNIFIFAAIDPSEQGERCRKILKMIDERKVSCAASYLVIDEVIWVLKKKLGKEDALRIARTMLSLPIRWLSVDFQVMLSMLESYEKSKLSPRDALHLASMKENGISTIISEDSDFDGLEGIERISSSECMARCRSK